MSTPQVLIHQITFLRHAQSIANQGRIVQGQQNSPLSDLGIQQAQALGKYWTSEGITFDHIVCSPLQRARMTVELAIDKNIEIELDEQWKERNYGNAEGMDYETFRHTLNANSDRSPYTPVFETGESDWDLYLRASSAIQKILRRPCGHYLVVTHGGILNAALHSILGLSPSTSGGRSIMRTSNTGSAHVRYNRTWMVLSLNDTRHLASKFFTPTKKKANKK